VRDEAQQTDQQQHDEQDASSRRRDEVRRVLMRAKTVTPRAGF
jgi:hypothetical protein